MSLLSYEGTLEAVRVCADPALGKDDRDAAERYLAGFKTK